MEKLKNLPVPVLPTFVGALTLSNVYASTLGYIWIRHLTMFAATLVIIAYIFKIIMHTDICKNEYKTTVPCSLYAGFNMVLMILGSYYFDFNQTIGKILWFTGLIIHSVHILVFTYRNVIKTRNIDTFLPSWFVTYNGIMVSCVIGGNMNANEILKYVVYYGIIIYFIIIPIMIWRLLKFDVKPQFYHTMAVVLAPCSLCVVSYLNIIKNPNAVLLYILYACVLLSLLFIVVKLPKFFSFEFSPAFAGLTFPMAIGIVATSKMSAYLNNDISVILKQLEGIQIYITTAIIGYVLINLVRILLKIEKRV